LDLLKALQTIPITLEVLQKTRIGMTVNNLRKSITDEDVISLSKSLIKSWKKLLSEKDSKPDNDSNKTINNNNNNKMDSQRNNINNDLNKSKSSNANRPNSTSTPNTNNKPNNNQLPFRQTSFPADTSNSVRLKCRELLANALKHDDTYNDETLYEPEDLARKIEEHIFKEFKDTNMKYKNRIRSRISNLNDKKNPDLKLNVLRGSIKPEKIAVMTAEVWLQLSVLRNMFSLFNN
jgi:transcription elongation factor S-II